MQIDSLTTFFPDDNLPAVHEAARRRLDDLQAWARSGYQLVSSVAIPLPGEHGAVLIDTFSKSSE